MRTVANNIEAMDRRVITIYLKRISMDSRQAPARDGRRIQNGYRELWQEPPSFVAGQRRQTLTVTVTVRKMRHTEFSRNHGKYCRGRGIVFKNDVAHAGIPDSREQGGVFPGNHNEAIRLCLEKQQVFRPAAIHDDNAPDSRVRSVNDRNQAGAVFSQEVREGGGVPLIVDG